MEQLSNLARPVKASEMRLLYRLLQVKHGSMDGEAVEDYLTSFFGVSDLRLVSVQKMQEAVQTLALMPDRGNQSM